MEYKFGEYEWAIFKDGELFTCSLVSENECVDLIKDYEDNFDGVFEYRLISEEERVGG